MEDGTEDGEPSPKVIWHTLVTRRAGAHIEGGRLSWISGNYGGVSALCA